MYVITKSFPYSPNALLYLSDSSKTLSKFTVNKQKAKRYRFRAKPLIIALLCGAKLKKLES